MSLARSTPPKSVTTLPSPSNVGSSAPAPSAGEGNARKPTRRTSGTRSARAVLRACSPRILDRERTITVFPPPSHGITFAAGPQTPLGQPRDRRSRPRAALHLGCCIARGAGVSSEVEYLPALDEKQQPPR